MKHQYIYIYRYAGMIQYTVWCMHVDFLFPHTHTVDSFVCDVCVGCLSLFIASRTSDIRHICT